MVSNSMLEYREVHGSVCQYEKKSQYQNACVGYLLGIYTFIIVFNPFVSLFPTNERIKKPRVKVTASQF